MTKKAASTKNNSVKTETNGHVGRTKKEGLRGPQVRILKALAKAAQGNQKDLTRAQIAKLAPVDQAACVEYLGSHKEEVRIANDAKHFPSLVSLGLVRFGKEQEGNGVSYEITATGKKVADKA